MPPSETASPGQPAPTAPVAFAFLTSSIDEARAQVQASCASVDIQPLHRAYELRMVGAKADGLTAVHVYNPTGSSLQHLASNGEYAVLLPMRGAVEMITSHDQFMADASRVCLSDTLEHQRSRYREGTQLLSLFVDAAAIDARLAEETGRPVTSRVRFSRELPPAGSGARMLEYLVRCMLAGVQGDAPLAAAPLAWANLRQAMLSCLIACVPHDHRELADRASSSALPRHVRRAIEFMHAHAHHPITLADVASAAAVSPRSLQEGFKRHQGVTPTAFLRDLRLARVRADLLDPTRSASIAELATGWGFTHLGLFAARYRAAYGELPRDTLQRRP